MLSDKFPVTRVLAMPENTNTAGGVFGGWIMAQMDIAGSIVAHQKVGGKVSTVASEAMRFHEPVFVGDVVSCFTEILRVGKTSLTIKITLIAERDHARGECVNAAESTITYVAVDEFLSPREHGCN